MLSSFQSCSAKNKQTYLDVNTLEQLIDAPKSQKAL